MCGFESRLRHHFSGRSADRVLEVSGMITATRSPLHAALCDRLVASIVEEAQAIFRRLGARGQA